MFGVEPEPYVDLGSVFLLSLSLKDTIATHQGATLHRHWWSLRSMSALVFIISVIIIKKYIAMLAGVGGAHTMAPSSHGSIRLWHITELGS